MCSVTVDALLADALSNYPAATVACFDPTTGQLPRRKLDRQRNAQMLERLSRAGAAAVLIASSTGHGHLRSLEELQHWLAASAQADLGTTVKMALLRPEDGEQQNRQLAAQVKELGYLVAFVRPGRDLAANATDAEIAANMQPLVEAAADCQLAVGVYSIPDVSGVPLSVEATARLLDGPGGDHMVAIKVTEENYDKSTLAFLRDSRFAHLKIVQGWDTHLARALQDGPAHDPHARQRCGVTSGPMSFALHQYLHILDAASRQQWQEVQLAQQAVTALFQSMQDDPSKFADLQRAKFVMGLGQPLTQQVDQQQVDRVLKALEQLPRQEDRARLARSLDLMGDGPYHDRLAQWY
jgi:dihydrodipicolinate synthase/N-acetylneuraminate lyase